MTAATDERVGIGVDLDAEVLCVGIPDDCSLPAVFVVRIRHADCPAKTFPVPMCKPCLHRLRTLLSTREWGCGRCQWLALPEDLEVRPL